MTDAATQRLLARGIRLVDVARLVLKLQRPYLPGITLDECLRSVERVVRKREVQYALITGLTLDEMAEEGTLAEPLGAIVREDGELFGVDEVLALTIVNVYGSIGLSNFGYLAREKPGLLRKFNRPGGRVHTFTDDLVAALVAATCARLAHRRSTSGVEGSGGAAAGRGAGGA